MADWLIDDDPAVLGAALSFVATWDGVGEELSGAADDTRGSHVEQASKADTLASSVRKAAQTTDRETASKTLTRAARPQRINITRVRRKAEMELLRDESDALENQLLMLRQQREASLKAHYNGNSIQSTAPIWEKMARQQLQERKRSEEINVRLRRRVVDQSLVAHDLMKAVQVAMQRQTLQERLPRLQLPIDISQRMSEVEQLERLRDNVSKWQWALSLSPKFERGELQFRDYVVVESDCKAAVLDVYTSWAFPYPVTPVADLVWAIFHKDSSGDPVDDEDVDEYVAEQQTSDDLIIAVFSMESTMGGATTTQGTISGKWVSRHMALHEGAQRLIISQWHSELEGFGNELDGVSVDEDKWVRIVDARDIGHPQLTEPLAVLQHVRRVRISFNRSDGVDNDLVKAVTDLVVHEIENDLQFVERNLESTLLNQALRVMSTARLPWLLHI